MSQDSIICPYCGESGPTEAVICWACYSSIHKSHSSTKTSTDNLNDIRFIATETSLIALVVGVLLRRFNKTQFLPSAILTLIAWVAYRRAQTSPEAQERRRKRLERAFQARPYSKRRRPDDPIVRVVDTIILYAITENVDSIRIEIDNRGGHILYRLNGEWVERIRIPKSTTPLLISEFHHRLGPGTPSLGSFNFDASRAKVETYLNYLHRAEIAEEKFIIPQGNFQIGFIRPNEAPDSFSLSLQPLTG